MDKENNWISVDDDLPEYNEAVLWYRSGGDMIIAAMGPEDYPLPNGVIRGLTHWQPLPLAPPPMFRKVIKMAYGKK